MNRIYDFFLSMPEDRHLDRWLGQFAFEKEYFICKPFVTKQMGGYSDNMMKHQNYQVQESQFEFLQ